MNVAASSRRAGQPGAISVAGERALCDRRGALFFPDLALLAVSDLHLEKGSAAARRGSLLPPYDTAATLTSLKAVVDDYAPRIVVSLGDSFHDREGSARLPEPYRLALTALTSGRQWYWVSGNHDPDPPQGVGGESVSEVAFGPLIFRHEPSASITGAGEVAGHLHPGARVVQRGRSIRRRCFATDGSRMIMPAFGSYTGSLNVLDRAFAGLFSREGLIAHVLGMQRTYPIAGTMLSPG